MVDRLSVLEASLLQLESRNVHLHVGGLGVFEPGLGYTDVVRVLRERLEAVPLARRRVQLAPPGTGRPVWVDDADFDLSYHVRHAALPAPGDRRQLGEFLSRLIGRSLDRDRPLWELYVIDGLEGGRVGLFRKVHLAMAGPEGDAFAAALDEERSAPAEDPALPRWEAEPAPGITALAVDAAKHRADRVTRAVAATGEAVRQPRRVARDVAGSVIGLAGRLTRSAPPSPLNRRLSSHRRFATAEVDLAQLRAVRRACGGTVNDVVLAVVADAVGRLLRWRGHDTKDLDLRVMVPVKVAADVEESHLGLGIARTTSSGVAGVLAPLPVMEMDPVARLYRIMGEMAGIKESRQAVAASQLVSLAGYGPASLHAAAARMVTAEQRYNVALSNAPGPQAPRYLAGARMEQAYPFIPLAGDAALSVACNSYDGQVFFGLLGDRDALFDLDVLAAFVGEAVTELVDAAAEVGEGVPG